MKRIILLFLSIILSASLFLYSCSARDYSDKVRCAELAQTAQDCAKAENGYAIYGSDHIKYSFKNTDMHDDCCIIYSIDTNDINEIGIFHAKSADSVEALAELAQDYLTDMKQNQRAFIESYAPEETPKLDGARIYVLGNYVIYTILSAKDRDKVMQSIEDLLLQ